jgi:protein-S-isoprenylcysteine O-methyltransferase Ste14
MRMDRSLLAQAIGKYLSGLLAVAVLMFVPAGTLKYWNAWLLIGILFIPMLVVGAVLMFRNPDLLRKRLNAREKEAEQRSVIQAGGLMFVLGFVLAGLDYRYQWSHIPRWVVMTASGLFIFGYFLFAEVLRENAYVSRTVEVQENQKVIDTGLYGIVRHPMYLATILMFLSMPLVLGSLLSLAVFLVYPAITVKRIENEEKVLEKGLPGYAEYKKRVKYRLFPYIW